MNVLDEKTPNKMRKTTIVKLLGLDLVDGTPVYDLKPYIPSDIVTTTTTTGGTGIRTPGWVSDTDDELSAVEWTEEARESVHRYRKAGLLEPLYPAAAAVAVNVDNDDDDDNDDDNDNDNDEVIQAISEIVGQDPRAQHEGRGNATEGSSSYEITFSTLRIKFGVEYSVAKEDFQALIMEVVQDKGDVTAQPGSYQHSLGMRRKAEMEAKEKDTGTTLAWKYPVREGITEGLYILRDGSTYTFLSENEKL